MYHRRWANAGNDDSSSTTIQRNENVTQAIAPHTYGTSWNSVRWNKPLENGSGTGSKGYWNRSVPFFESISKDYDTKSSYSMPPLGRFGSQTVSKNNIELKNSGLYVRERSICFGDSVLSVMNDKRSSRTFPRLPWLSDNLTNRRNASYNKVARNLRENAFTANSRWASTSSATRSFQSGVRNIVPASSSSSSSLATSTSLHDRPFLNNMSQTINSSNHGNTAAHKSDRPWRRRMADAARLRNVHGNEIAGAVHSTLTTIRACRSNIPNGRNSTNSGDELRTSLNALKNYIDEQTTSFYRQNNRFSVRDCSIFSDKSSLDNSMISVKQHTPTRGLYSSRWNSGRFPEYMSRSHSPIRPRPSAYNNAKLSKYNSISTDMLLRPLRSTQQSNVNNMYENVKSHVFDQVIRNSPIPESICERESNDRLLSNKRRTLRHQSRQRKLSVESNSSSDTEQQQQQQQQQQTEVRKRKLRKRLRRKSSSKDGSESKQSQTGTEKGMMKTDNEISVKIDIQKENVAKAKKMQRNQILNNSQASSLITFPATCNEESELRIKSTEFDQARLKKIDKEREDKMIKEELKGFVKRRKSTDKCDSTANYINHKKETTNAIVEKKKENENHRDNKCIECNEIPMGMLKMLNIDVKLTDGREKSRLDQFSPSFRLLSPKTPSSSNSSPRNATMDISINNHLEANEKCHDDLAHQFDSPDKTKHSKSKSPAVPVPGTWNGPDYHEMNISHNKRLQRHETCSNEKVLGVIIMKYISCTVPATTICATKLKSRRPVEITLNCAFQPLIENNEKISSTQKYSRFIKVDKKLLATTNATIKFDGSFTPQKRSTKGMVDKIIEIKRKHITFSMVIKEPTIRTITIREVICKKSDGRNSCRAQVTVIASLIADVNFYRCLKRVQITHSKRYPTSIENITKQAFIVDKNNTILSENDEFILSNHSSLKKHVNYKCKKLKRIHSEPAELDSRELSCPLPVSEIMRACAVRILEPTCQVPYITAPSRSRLGSVEVETVAKPIRTYGEQLLSTNYHGMKNLAADRSECSTSLTKPFFEFDVAMSPFEQRLQNQALKLRKISTFSDGDIPAVQDIPTVNVTMQLPLHDHSRHSSVEGSSLTSNFTAAVAAAAQPRHERYAAHIPVKRVDGSGRQSTTSIDSYNSGTLETTTLQLDQMIDQARYRHNQHRNKFKEAIDYLDQIFEDLNKEDDQINNTQRSRGIAIASTRKEISKNGTNLMNAAVSSPSVKLQQRNGNYCSNDKQTAANIVGLEEMDSVATTNRHINRYSLYESKPRVTKKPCVREKAASFEQTSDDVEISEIVVLPLQNRKLKGERMDFTRRWLTGDIKSWITVQPKPDLILDGVQEEPDIDECSLGSCSAEVAAINSVDRKKKKARDVPDLIQNVAPKVKYVRQQSTGHRMDYHSTRKYSGGSGNGQYVQQTDPIKPLPIKAHHTFNFSTGSAGNLHNFNNFSQSFHDNNVWASNHDVNSNQIPLERIPSHSRLLEQRNRDFSTVSWRSASHDSRYNTLSSARSEEVQLSTRKTGAFTPVQQPNILTVRGSVASLPDSSKFRSQLPHSSDPTVTIDALVAELELNTDQTSVASKRRSFPTGNEFFVRHTDNYEKPISSQQVEHNNIQIAAKTKSEYNINRMQQQQPQKPKDSFGEMANMLQSVINDVTTSNELSKGRKYVQTRVKNSSILSPFETINQEKLNPSKVEAMQSIFENKKHAPAKRYGIFTSYNDNTQSTTNVKDDENYYEINDFVVLRKEFIPASAKSLGKQFSSAIPPNSQSKRYLPSVAVPSRSEFIPAFPVTHPPSRPPDSRNSSQIDGYYSSGSSLGAQSSYTLSKNHHSSIPINSPGNREMMVSGKQSISSQEINLNGEDDGFYDNIQADEKRFSRASELDNVSTYSHQILSTTISKPSGPVKKSSRISHFLRKINASKPPISAASLVSLNKVASEIMPTKPVPLMKSNSLNHCQAITDKRAGLGQRLKNSIFGNKKRLN
ncbi:hypothetical protein ACH3XW_11070 [Acanthocheilonema viteae]